MEMTKEELIAFSSVGKKVSVDEPFNAPGTAIGLSLTRYDTRPARKYLGWPTRRRTLCILI